VNEKEFNEYLQGIERLNADLYRRIGMLCTFFAGLEIQLRDCIAQIEKSHNQPESDRLKSEESYRRTVGHFERVLSQCLTQTGAKIGLELVPRLREVGRMRNEIVHSSWNATAGGLFCVERVRPQEGVLRTVHVLGGPSMIDDTTEEIAEIIFALACFQNEHLKFGTT
jgi:hypothetical protein